MLYSVNVIAVSCPRPARVCQVRYPGLLVILRPFVSIMLFLTRSFLVFHLKKKKKIWQICKIFTGSYTDLTKFAVGTVLMCI